MKRLFLVFAITCVAILSIHAQNKFQVKDFGDFKLHTFVSANPLGDMNYIIEGKNGLVVLEPVTFVEDIKLFDAYLKKLGKPIEKVIANFHIVGFNAYDQSKIVMIEGMPEYAASDRYQGLMKSFATNFGEAIDSRENKPAPTVTKNAKEKWAGVSFAFSPASPGGMPAADINIGGKVYFTHFTPAIAHFNTMRVRDKASIDAVLVELEKAKASGCQTFIGGHGAAIADIKTVDFQIGYLKKMKELLGKEATSAGFITAMQKAYPNIDGSDNLSKVAEGLYK